MGDKVSISFRRGGNESVVLFSQWGGADFLRQANTYADHLRVARIGTKALLDPLEPNRAMVDFIQSLTTDNVSRGASDLYLAATPEDGTGVSDGHYVVRLDRGEKG